MKKIFTATLFLFLLTGCDVLENAQKEAGEAVTNLQNEATKVTDTVTQKVDQVNTAVDSVHTAVDSVDKAVSDVKAIGQ